MAKQSLKEKTVKGVGWSAADAFLGHGVTFIVGLILARLLSPEEYGLVGIVMIFTTVLVGFIDSGFSNALIRKIDATDDDYNTEFIVNMVMSLFMYGLLFVCAPYIAAFFNRPQLVCLCRVMGLIIIFQALSVVQYTILSRRLDFKTKTKASFYSAMASGVIGIILAYSGFGVWSLVAQQLSKQLFYSLSLWVYNKWWPKWKFSLESLRYMWGFGWKLLLSGMLDRVWAELYQTVVGKFYSPATLGQYTRSKEYATIFSSNLSGIVKRVSYPVLSQVQDDPQRMVAAYRKIIKTTMFVTAVCMISLGAVAEPLIYCLIGPQWHQAATFLPFICVSMSLYPLHAINLNMLQVQGRTDIYLYLEVVKKLIAILPLCLGIFWDIYWMLIGTVVTGLIAFFLNSHYTGKKLGYNSLMQLKDVSSSYALAFVIAVSVYFIKYLDINYWLVLILQIVLGAGVFFVVCELVKIPEYLEIKSIGKSLCYKILLRK